MTGNVIVDDGASLVGQNLRGFVVEALIGEGGMGEVYRARHETLPKPAAVKVLKADFAADEEWKRRFVREAEAISSLKHPAIVQLYNFGTLGDGRQYLVMEFIDGQPLDELIAQRGSLTPHETLAIAEQVLDGLAEAHKAGVVHRDLKPANVILERTGSLEPRVKLVDFGLARQARSRESKLLLAAEGPSDGRSSLLAGTPHYIAPEQALGNVVNGRADVYSLGVMLYEMLSGRLPFDDENVVRLVERQIHEAPVPLGQVASYLSSDVAAFVDSLLAKSPSGRPSAESARNQVKRFRRELAEAGTVRAAIGSADLSTLRRVVPPPKGVALDTTTVTEPGQRGAPPARRRWAALAPVLLLLVLGAWWAGPGRSEPATAPRAAEPEPEPKPEPASAPPVSPSPEEPPVQLAPATVDPSPPVAPPSARARPRDRATPTPAAVDDDVRKCNSELTAYSEQLEQRLRGKLSAERRDGEIDHALKALRTLRKEVAANHTLKGCEHLDARLDGFGVSAGL